jgi:hypothetical protein
LNEAVWASEWLEKRFSVSSIIFSFLNNANGRAYVFAFFITTGKVNEGLVLHPDNEHIVFPLGTTIVVRHIISRTQQFLQGHDNDISVITVSSSGKYIASGQKTHSGFQVMFLY